MNTPTGIVPAQVALTAEDLARLVAILEKYDGAMSLEEVDGLFYALICGPDPILPGEFLVEIFDGDLYLASDAVTESEAVEATKLLRRYWNGLRDNIREGRTCRIFLSQAGTQECAQWINAFMTGVEMRSASWKDLIEQSGHGLLGPFRYFDDESGPYPAGEFKPVAPLERAALFRLMEESLPAIYRHFQAQRDKSFADADVADVWEGRIATSALPPLTMDEMVWLEKFIDRIAGDLGMPFDALDGFFTALIAGPVAMSPDDYLPIVFGRKTDKLSELGTPEETQRALQCMKRHLNTIALDMASGESHLPVLGEDEKGELLANDWATGFMHGVALAGEVWSEWTGDLVESGPVTELLTPMLLLAGENDPGVRPRLPVIRGRKKREKIIGLMTIGTLALYHYFRPQLGEWDGLDSDGEFIDDALLLRGPKVGRNEPCPCGSEKKYKKCCGR